MQNSVTLAVDRPKARPSSYRPAVRRSYRIESISGDCIFSCSLFQIYGLFLQISPLIAFVHFSSCSETSIMCANRSISLLPDPSVSLHVGMCCHHCDLLRRPPQPARNLILQGLESKSRYPCALRERQHALRYLYYNI